MLSRRADAEDGTASHEPLWVMCGASAVDSSVVVESFGCPTTEVLELWIAPFPTPTGLCGEWSSDTLDFEAPPRETAQRSALASAFDPEPACKSGATHEDFVELRVE